jgi:hypothetical protein
MGGPGSPQFRIAWADAAMKHVAGPVAGRLARRPLMIGLMGVVALVCSGCGGGGQQHLGASPVDHHAVVRVKTAPATATTQPSPSTTTTTAPAVKTGASTFAPAAQPAPVPPVTTTTTNPFPPPCVWSNFVARVSTDQSTYSPGQPVQIMLGFANTGPACTVNTTGYACPLVTIDTAAGALVWSSAAPTSVGCPSTFTGPTVLAASWSQGFSFAWGQTSCTPGQAAACPGPPVPAGQYEVIGQSGGGSSQIPAGTPAAVTLTAASS